MRTGWLWNRVARRYDAGMRKDEDFARLVERSARSLGPDDRVLDFACASGLASFGVAPSVREVLGIDTSTRMIALAEARRVELEVPNVEFAVGTIFDAALEPESFDAVLAFNILHLVEDAEATARRAAELLRPGGTLISTTPCLREAGLLLRALPGLVTGVGMCAYLRKMKPADIEGSMDSAGLERLESETSQGAIPSCFIVARKPPG